MWIPREKPAILGARNLRREGHTVQSLLTTYNDIIKHVRLPREANSRQGENEKVTLSLLPEENWCFGEQYAFER